MQYTSKSLERLIEAFAGLPGIGVKSAQRVALYLLDSAREESEALAEAILSLKDHVKRCRICFNLTEEAVCGICGDQKRDQQVICVIEEPKDLMAIERTGAYKGLYHVLGGALSPLEGIGEKDLHIQDLFNRIDESVNEIIIATNPTMEGEMTAAHICKMLRLTHVNISRIARGIPFGGSLEFNDTVTVAKAMEGRVGYKKDDTE